jgi:non-homologous end joining protein Ku
LAPATAGPALCVVNLMNALRASVDAEKKKVPAPSIQGCQ